MTKRQLENEVARLKAENADLRRKIEKMGKLSAEQFKRLQEAEMNAQRYFMEAMNANKEM
jgi:hypothetical protein